MEKLDFKSISLLLLRLAIVFDFLWHGIPKAFGPAAAMTKFNAMGFPGFLGPIIGWIEVILAIFILVGFWYKWSNVVLAIIILVAILGVHQPWISAQFVPFERNLFMLVGLLVAAAFGPGPYAMKQPK